MSDLPTHFRVAQLVGTLGASWLSGNMAALSLISVPALMRSQSEDHVAPVDVARSFKRILEKGGMNPPLIALVACTNGYLAWSYRPGSWCQRAFPDVDMVPYLAAAALTFSIVPFTMVAIIPINKAMVQKAEGLRKPGSSGKSSATDDTQELLGRWAVRNGVRSLLALVAAALTLREVL
ncbi:hypothetical protein BDV09DRAFT_190647 [Aspergillus tetrazonus]